MGYCYIISLSGYENAISCYGKVIEIDPDHAFAWFNMGSCLGIMQRYDEAIKCYYEAL
jgi:tetratricopeptide (TPR) repeat protein